MVLVVRKLKGKKVSKDLQFIEKERERIRAEIRQQLGITEEEENQINDYVESRKKNGDIRSFEELFNEGYIKLIEEDNLRRAKKREQIRKDLGITEQEEKEIYDYIQEQERKGNPKTFNDLFKEGYFIVIDKREKELYKVSDKRKKEKRYSSSSERKEIKTPTRADLQILKEESKKKLGDNKTERFTMRISEKEKSIIEELKVSGIDFVEEIRKLILTLDKNISREYFQEEWESLQEKLYQVEVNIKLLQKKIKKLKEMKDKAQVNINELELYRYNIIDLRREKRRIEKHLEKYKIIFE